MNIHVFSTNGFDFLPHLATLKVKFDVKSLTEIWLTVADKNINIFPGYTSYDSVRERRGGGCVSVFKDSKVESNQPHEHSFNYNFFSINLLKCEERK